MKFHHPIRVFPPPIRLGTVPIVPMTVPSTTQRALSNGMLRFFLAQNNIFRIIAWVKELQELNFELGKI